MAFNVSYIYEILDRYSAPLRKIVDKVKKFQQSTQLAKKRTDNLSKSLAVMSGGLVATGHAASIGALPQVIKLGGRFSWLGMMVTRNAIPPFHNFKRILKSFIATARSAQKAATSLGKKLRKIGDGISSFGQSMTARITLAGVAITGFALKAASDFEQFEVSFGVMLGGVKKGEAMMRDLAAFGQKTPFELKGIAAATKKMLGFGVAGKDIVARLSMLGDISSGVGKPLTEMAQIFGKIKAKGKAMTEEIMQFAEAGVPIIDVLAERVKGRFGGNIDKAKASILKMAEKGLIKFKDIKGALASMTEEGGRFYKMMEKQSNTFGGLMSNLRDATDMALVTLGKTIIKSFGLKNVLRSLIAKVEEITESFRIWAEANPELAKMVLTFAGLLMTVGPLLLVLGPLVKMFGWLFAGAGAVSIVLVAVGAGVALLAAMFARWNNINHPVIKSLKRLWNALAPLWTGFDFLWFVLMRVVRWFTGTNEEAGILAHTFDVIGLALIPVIAALSGLLNLLFSDTEGNAFEGMMADLNEFREGTSMVAQVYDGMVTRVAAWMTAVSDFFTMIGDKITAFIDKITLATKILQKTGMFGGNGGLIQYLSGDSGEKSADTKVQNSKSQGVDISGSIAVQGKDGTTIEKAAINLNQGDNLATVMQ